VAYSFMNGPGYKAPGQTFSDGILVNLDDQFVDDKQRGPKLDDLTTIFSRVINGIDIGGFIPSPVVTYAGFDVYLKNLDYDEPRLALTPAGGALNMNLIIDNLEVDVDADGFINVGGSISVNRINVTLALEITIVNGAPKVTARTTSVLVTGLNIDVHWSINWIIDFFEDDVRDTLSGAFTDVLKDEVPPLVQDALKAFELSQSFAMPAFLPGMQPVNIELKAKPRMIPRSDVWV
jgi:hypothetical protein